jgi:hypothetical protein
MEDKHKQQKDGSPGGREINTIYLENGLEVNLVDDSTLMAGDRWKVCLTVRISMEIDSFLRQSGDIDVDEIKQALGETVDYEHKTKRIFVRDQDKDDLVLSLVETFMADMLPYISRTEFPRKFILRQFNS